MLLRKRVDKILNIEEMRAQAKWLPRAVFDAIDGAAGDEITLRANRTAFDRIWLRPRALADVSSRDLSTTVLGRRISMPLMLAPCGFARMANSQAELAVARAAGKAGTLFAVSGSASYLVDEIAKAATGPLWYQLYLPPKQTDADALIDRVERSGYDVLCITIDTAVTPKRERDYRNKLTVPLKMSPRLAWAGLSHPVWAKDFVMGNVGTRGVAPGVVGGARTAYWSFAKTVQNMRPVTMTDLERIRARWKGKIVIKGIMRGDECAAIVDAGVDGIVVSNHGGRNLDCVRPSIQILPEVVAAVDGRAEVYVDSGIRRGTDVIKALALGARACLVGRPYMFGLAVGGEAGVARVLEIFRNEIEHSMALTGCATVGDIDKSLVTAA
jgi:isopentenyl diphosphate isomerase/L-lactate dehydrogenase-like FMN-dependent dehydrogenase